MTTTDDRPTPPPIFRSLIQMAVEKVGPLLVPAGLMLADLGLAVRRGALAEMEQRTAELVEHTAELERRAAELQDLIVSRERAAVTAESGVYVDAGADELDDAAVERAYDALTKGLGRQPISSDFLAAGWHRSGYGWRPPRTAAADQLDVPPRAEEPGPLMWNEGPADDVGALRCAFDGGEVLTIYGDEGKPGTLVCETCERTAPEPPELQAHRLAVGLAANQAAPVTGPAVDEWLAEHDPKQQP